MYIHGVFGRQANITAIDRRAEADALFRYLAQALEAENLETPGIGEDGMRPVHKPMQATVGRNDVRTRPQHQVKGVTENDVRAQPFEFFRRHRFDGAVGTHGHEGGRFDHAMGRSQPTETRRTFRRQNFKLGPQARSVMNMASP